MKAKFIFGALAVFAAFPAAALDNIIRMQAPIAYVAPNSGLPETPGNPGGETPEQPETPDVPEDGAEFSFMSNVLPEGRFGDSYSTDLNLLIAHYPENTRLKWQSTSVPAGLSLSTSGIISGEPMAVGPQSVTVIASDGVVEKSATLSLSVAANSGTYSMSAETGSGTGTRGVLQAVGSYKTDLYDVSMGNVIRDEYGNRIMAYMHKLAGVCYANVANTTGDGYSTSAGAASAGSKAWIQSHPTLVFNSSNGVYATYTGGSSQSYYNGWYKSWVISCSVFSAWYENPGLITSVTFR